jgi:hypothetical protein
MKKVENFFPHFHLKSVTISQRTKIISSPTAVKWWSEGVIYFFYIFEYFVSMGRKKACVAPAAGFFPPHRYKIFKKY